MNFLLLVLPIQYIFLPITNLYYIVLQKKGNLSPRFHRAQMQLTKFSRLKLIHTPGKNLSVADMSIRSFTKAEKQLNQLKHQQLPKQIDSALLQNGTLKPVHYLIKHEEILPHQKHDSHPILADYGTDQFSIRIKTKTTSQASSCLMTIH